MCFVKQAAEIFEGECIRNLGEIEAVGDNASAVVGIICQKVSVADKI